jgi:hypothetical protein
MDSTPDVGAPTRLRALISRRWIVPAMLLALHGALVSEPESAFVRACMLVHFGLFLLWQPFFSTRRRIEPLAALMLLVIVGLILSFVADWMIVSWVLLLLGILGGRVFTSAPAARDRFYIVAFAYLLGILLLWAVPHLLLEQPMVESVSIFARLVLPWVLVVLVFLPSPTEREEGQVFDFFYAVMVFQLGVVLALGAIASMRFTGEQYFTSVALTASSFGVALFVLAVLWSPLRGFGGLRTYFSRYLLSVGMPFELWMRRIAELAETEKDSRRFIELCVEELSRLPWIVGGRWRSPDGEGEFGRAAGHSTTFTHQSLEIVFFTRLALSPALFLHIRLLARVIGQFYEAKRREVAMRHNAYLQAVHETGARLTHDVKNLLQSLYALMSLAPPEGSDGYANLLQRQIPQVTQRLHATLEKLRAPEAATTELSMPGREWWSALEKRFPDENIEFSSAVETDRAVPAPLFDSFVENAVENARAKAAREPGLRIHIAFRSSAQGIEVQVGDTGTAIAAGVADRLFREPIERDSGFGIGLYHVARQAQAAGYRASLAANGDGNVRFTLSLER